MTISNTLLAKLKDTSLARPGRYSVDYRRARIPVVDSRQQPSIETTDEGCARQPDCGTRFMRG
jgi:hypothetical protein